MTVMPRTTTAKSAPSLLASGKTRPAAAAPRRRPYAPGGRAKFTLITDRDRAIFRALFEHRYLTFEQLVSLVPRHEHSKSSAGHEKKLRDRLTELFHTSHVNRIRTQRYPSVYALGAAGAEHIDITDIDADFDRLDWIKRTNAASWHFIEHGVEVAHVNIAFDAGLARHAGVTSIAGRHLLQAIRDTIPLPPTRNPLLIRQPVTLELFDRDKQRRVARTEEVGTVPDTFRLLALSPTLQRAFPIELDRGTEPIRHRGFDKSSIERKLRVYAAAAASASINDRWGTKTFVVLFITPSAKRSKNIRDMAKAIGTDVVWTAEYQTVLREPLLARYWLDPTGAAHALLPEKLIK